MRHQRWISALVWNEYFHVRRTTQHTGSANSDALLHLTHSTTHNRLSYLFLPPPPPLPSLTPAIFSNYSVQTHENKHSRCQVRPNPNTCTYNHLSKLRNMYVQESRAVYWTTSIQFSRYIFLLLQHHRSQQVWSTMPGTVDGERMTKLLTGEQINHILFDLYAPPDLPL